jgi:sortase (surface protein transpeptidase)
MVPGGRFRHLAVPLALAVTVAVGGSLVAFGAAPAASPAAPTGQDAAAIAGGWHAAAKRAPFRVTRLAAVAERGAGDRQPPALATPANAVAIAPVASSRPATAATPSTTSKPPKSTASPTTYRGRNHVWIPSLGVNRSVSFYSCSRSTPLANVVYRWGCAGSNNVYLMGHAHSVFRALHNAYYNGRLRKGMEVIYADGNGRVTRYRVSFWKVVSPVGQSWAFASQSRPSLTLQTCVGKNSQYRLVVRLVKSG